MISGSGIPQRAASPNLHPHTTPQMLFAAKNNFSSIGRLRGCIKG